MELSGPKRLADALMGRRPQPEPPAPARYTLGEIAERLCSLPDEAFDGYAFSREPLRGKLEPALRRELAQQARACGRAEAEKLRARYPGRTPGELCGLLGLKVERPKTPSGGGHVIYAQFVQPDQITVFTDCLDTAQAYAEPDGPLSVLNSERLEQVLLAHELFHFLEEQDKALFSQSYRLRLWRLGPLKNDSRLVCLGEIAGMAFAKRLLGLQFCPYALDALLVYGYSAQNACDLCDEMLELKKMEEESQC